MPGGQGGDQSILGQHGLDNRRVIDTDSAETDINPPGLQRLYLLQGGHLRQPQFKFQVLMVAQAANQFRQHAVKRRWRETDAQPGLFAQADSPRVVANLAQLLEQRTRMLMKKTPGIGQLQRPAPFEQLHPEFLLQLLDLSAQWRLGNVQQLGGAGEVEGLSQHLKVPQVTQFHETSEC